MDINSRNLGQQEEDLDKKKFRKRASMSLSSNKCSSCLHTEILNPNVIINEDVQ